MNDTQRMDWLERELESVLSRRDWTDGSSKFRVVIASKPGLTRTYSDEYDTLREAVDEGIRVKTLLPLSHAVEDRVDRPTGRTLRDEGD